MWGKVIASAQVAHVYGILCLLSPSCFTRILMCCIQCYGNIYNADVLWCRSHVALSLTFGIILNAHGLPHSDGAVMVAGTLSPFGRV